MRSPTPQRSSTSASCPNSGPEVRVRSEAPAGTVPAKPAGVDAATPGADLCQLYSTQLSMHGFASDAAQLAVVMKLEGLRQRLLAGKPGHGIQLPHWLARLLAREMVPERGIY